MKHGSHIMLQRFVRSTVSTAPRPYLIDDVPWLCRLPVIGRVVAAGKEALDALRNAGSMASTSREGAVRRARLLDDDRAVALDDRRGDLADVARESACRWPARRARMRARASRTHAGQSESVRRGQPSGGRDRSVLLTNGRGAHSRMKRTIRQRSIDPLHDRP